MKRKTFQYLPNPINNKTTEIIKHKKEILRPVGKPPETEEPPCLRLVEPLFALSSPVLNCKQTTYQIRIVNKGDKKDYKTYYKIGKKNYFLPKRNQISCFI